MTSETSSFDVPTVLLFLMLTTSSGACGAHSTNAEATAGPTDSSDSGSAPAVSYCEDATTPKQLLNIPPPPVGAGTEGLTVEIDVHGSNLVAGYMKTSSGAGWLEIIDLATRSTRTRITNRNTPVAVAVGTTYGYWSDLGIVGDPNPTASLRRARLSTSSAPEVVGSVGISRNTVVVEDTVYWGAADGSIAALPSNATASALLEKDHYPYVLAADAMFVYWLTAPGVPRSLDRVPRAGGAVEHLKDGAWGGLAADGTDLYLWEPSPGQVAIEYFSGQLHRIPMQGGGMDSIITDQLPSSRGLIVADARSIYLPAAEGVYRVRKASGQGEFVAKGTDMVDGHLIMSPAYDVAVDGSCVYWSAPTGVYVEKK